jgi:hypothetical protein
MSFNSLVGKARGNIGSFKRMKTFKKRLKGALRTHERKRPVHWYTKAYSGVAPGRASNKKMNKLGK